MEKQLWTCNQVFSVQAFAIRPDVPMRNFGLKLPPSVEVSVPYLTLQQLDPSSCLAIEYICMNNQRPTNKQYQLLRASQYLHVCV